MQLLNALRNHLNTQPDRSSIAPSDAYALLSNERRRHIVEYLATHEDDVVSLRDIADYLADTMDDDRQTCYISVYQQHAPHMQRAGVVTHDDQAQTFHVHSSLHRVYDAHTGFKESLE